MKQFVEQINYNLEVCVIEFDHTVKILTLLSLICFSVWCTLYHSPILQYCFFTLHWINWTNSNSFLFFLSLITARRLHSSVIQVRRKKQRMWLWQLYWSWNDNRRTKWRIRRFLIKVSAIGFTDSLVRSYMIVLAFKKRREL